MSATRFAKLERDLREAVAGAAWIQWQAMGGQAAARRPPASIVDPEALVHFSLQFMRDEPRLGDFLYGFAELGSRLLSVQRMKRLAISFPGTAEAGLATFAAAVTRFGKDPRWRRLTTAGNPPLGRPGKSSTPIRRLTEPGALMLRLRTAFGVDVRTDVLAYLLGRSEAWADVREIAEALGYARFSVRVACESLANARLIEEGETRPVKYYANAARWGAFLGLRRVPPWRPWVALYALSLRLLEWLRTEGSRSSSDSLASSLARDLMDAHTGVLKQLQLRVPDSRDTLGEAYLPVFEETVAALATWLTETA